VTDPVLMLVLPLLGAFLLPIVHRRSAIIGRALGPAILTINVMIGLVLWNHVSHAGPVAVAMGGFPAPLGIVFYADGLAVVFALLAAFTLILFGFGVKAELFPVNTWVPEVYTASSVRVSGLLRRRHLQDRPARHRAAAAARICIDARSPAAVGAGRAERIPFGGIHGFD
jgi:formate hydrogenlyase subunit 3/multisubunit Na+/H+ antiporter MnhD subunit